MHNAIMHLMKKLRLFISESHNPWFNLAMEEAIFNQMAPTQNVLFLWRNADTVVIGRAQNPWKECNTKKMEEDGITLARRSSGGGAVFQDLGNTCFTFMAGKPGYDKSVSTQIVLNALARLGLQVRASGRNDLVVSTEEGDRKISGSAYKETGDRGFHHGTLMLDIDLGRLANYLNPDQKKLQAKGITSVRSRVANLNDLKPGINHQKMCQAMIEAFFEHYGQRVDAEYISPEQMPDLPHFEAIFEKQSSWEWNFGKALAFTHHLDERFVWGGVDVHLDVANGLIIQAKIYTDSLQPTPFEVLASRLQGCRYQAQAVQVCCESVLQDNLHQQAEFEEFIHWLIQALY